jgi:hypothetical protein
MQQSPNGPHTTNTLFRLRFIFYFFVLTEKSKISFGSNQGRIPAFTTGHFVKRWLFFAKSHARKLLSGIHFTGFDKIPAKNMRE